MREKREYKGNITPESTHRAQSITNGHEHLRIYGNDHVSSLEDVPEPMSSDDFAEDQGDHQPSAPSSDSISLPATPEITSVQQRTQPGVVVSPRQFSQEALAASLTDAALLDHLKINVFGPMRRCLKDHVLYLREARERFGQRGRRVPVPGSPTWTEFCEEQLGVNVRTVQRILAGDKAKPLTDLEAKLLGTAAAAHETITDLRAGRVE